MCFWKKDDGFKQELDHEIALGNWVTKNEEEEWFISIGTSLEEITESSVFMMRLYIPKHGCVCRSNLVIDKNGEQLFIGDIESDIENRGYGSIVMKNIIKIAQELNVKTITGNLSKVDSDHFNKLEHFYKKFGFTVKFDDDYKKGSIELNII